MIQNIIKREIMNIGLKKAGLPPIRLPFSSKVGLVIAARLESCGNGCPLGEQ